MKKVRSNASWNQLTPEQRKTLDGWLFKENLSYEAVLQKAESELGYKGSESSLQRYHTRQQQERLSTNVTELVTDAVEIQKLGVEPDVSRKASFLVAGAFLFRMLREAPEKVKEWGPLANLLIQNDHNEAWREIKGEEQKIRREALDFAKGKFQADMVEQALMALPDLLDLARARRAVEPDAYAENALLNRVRKKMFGVVWEVRPESAEEEKAMKSRKQPEAGHKGMEIAGLAEPVAGSAGYAEYLEWKGKRENREKAPATNIQASTFHE